MEIRIGKPIGFSEIGNKENQEDAVWPRFDAVSENQRVVILCDGMGGHAHGEVASQTMSEALGQALADDMEGNAKLTDEAFNAAMSVAYDALDAADDDKDESKMGTTLTCVCFDAEGCLAAHIGDSRIYQVRPGKGIVYQSSDHSWVNMMVKLGEMTPQEAAHHPKRNIILRACQPHTDSRAVAEIHRLTNIKSGDYFFLCCDGILEQLSDARLLQILSMDVADSEKLALIKKECYGKTRDNFTCYLIPVKEAVGTQTTDDGLDVPADDIELVVTVDAPAPNQYADTRNSTQKKRLLAASLLLIALVAGLAFWIRSCKPDAKGNDEDRTAFVEDSTMWVNCMTADDYRRYIEKYPEGSYVKAAKKRLKEAEEKAKAKVEAEAKAKAKAEANANAKEEAEAKPKTEAKPMTEENALQNLKRSEQVNDLRTSVNSKAEEKPSDTSSATQSGAVNQTETDTVPTPKPDSLSGTGV